MTLSSLPRPEAPKCLMGPDCPCRDIPDTLIQAVLTAWMAQDAPTRPATLPAPIPSNRPSLEQLLLEALRELRATNSPEPA